MYKTTAEIDGMMCSMCESHIQEAIRNNFSVKKVKASRSKKIAEIISSEPISESSLKEVIDKTGYTLLSVKTEEYKKKGLWQG